MVDATPDPVIAAALPAPIAGNTLKGILLVVAAVLVFALADTATKYLAQTHPIPLIVALRYGVNLVLLVALLGPSHGTGLIRTRRTGLVLVRAGCLAIASLCLGLALKQMPVGETIAIIFLAPFGVMLLAGPLLGERVSLAAWIATIVGFAGVLLIVRPGAGLAPLGVVFALVTAAVSVGYHLLSRILSRTESTLALLTWTAIVGTCAFGPALLWTWEDFQPTRFDLLLLLALGALATLGHFLFTAAYREAPAPILAPVNYLHLVWAGLLGLIFFDHVPDPVSLLGMALVALSGVAIALRSYLASR